MIGRLLSVKHKAGFTLIELLLVIALIGILASLASVNYIEIRKKARDATRKTDVLHIQSQLEQYHASTGSYPVSQPDSAQVNNVPCGQPFQTTDMTFLSKIPCDPLGGASNYNNGDYYYYSPDGQSYTIGACLERRSDPDGQATPP